MATAVGSAAVRVRPDVATWALVSSGLSPVLLVVGWLVADAVQPVDYSPVRQTVSVLAGEGGAHRWIMTSSLFAVGCCQLVTAAGFSWLRTSARIALVVAGLAAFGVAASPQPAHGSNTAHVAWTMLGALTIAVWPAFVARRGWPHPAMLGARGSVVATAVFLLLLVWLVVEAREAGFGLGLAERVSSAIQTTWPFAVALAVRRGAAYQAVAT